MFDLIRFIYEAAMALGVSQGIKIALVESLVVAKGTDLLHDVVLNPTCNIGCRKIFLMPVSKLNVQVITELVVLCCNLSLTECNLMLKESNTTKLLGIQLQHVQPVVGFLAPLLIFGFVLFNDSLHWI